MTQAGFFGSGFSQYGTPLGRTLRDEGIASVEEHAGSWMEEARDLAADLCHRFGTCTSDDLQDRLDLPPGVHHNAWGAVFKDSRFVRTGELVQSRRPSAHARWIHVWRLSSAPPRFTPASETDSNSASGGINPPGDGEGN